MAAVCCCGSCVLLRKNYKRTLTDSQHKFCTKQTPQNANTHYTQTYLPTVFSADGLALNRLGRTRTATEKTYELTCLHAGNTSKALRATDLYASGLIPDEVAEYGSESFHNSQTQNYPAPTDSWGV